MAEELGRSEESVESALKRYGCTRSEHRMVRRRSEGKKDQVIQMMKRGYHRRDIMEATGLSPSGLHSIMVKVIRKRAGKYKNPHQDWVKPYVHRCYKDWPGHLRRHRPGWNPKDKERSGLSYAGY